MFIIRFNSIQFTGKTLSFHHYLFVSFFESGEPLFGSLGHKTFAIIITIDWNTMNEWRHAAVFSGQLYILVYYAATTIHTQGYCFFFKCECEFIIIIILLEWQFVCFQQMFKNGSGSFGDLNTWWHAYLCVCESFFFRIRIFFFSFNYIIIFSFFHSVSLCWLLLLLYFYY